MNKKLISGAIAALVALPMSVNADVTISGNLHVSVDSYDSGQSGMGATNSDGLTVNSGFSYISFAGDEDLGNGLKTVWTIDTLLYPDEDGTQWGTGNVYLGLAGDFGTAFAGRHDSPFLMFGGAFDAFDSTVGDMNSIMGNNGANSHGYDLALDNALVYISPEMSGLQIIAGYTTDFDGSAGTFDNNDEDAVSVSMTYTSGSLMLGGAYEEHEDINDTYGIRLGAKMGMGSTNFGVLWETMDGDALNGWDRDAWSFFVTQGFGANTFKVAYTTTDESQNGASDGSDMWAIGLDHAMSKRTSAYVVYSALENEGSALRSIGGPDRSDNLDALS